MSLAAPKDAASHYGVTPETLRDWSDQGIIEFTLTAGGHRRYIIKENRVGRQIVYARVSSKKQENDLDRQVKYLAKRYPNYEIVRDIGSGINFQRQGFKSILENLFKKNIREVVVASADRFSRFGASDFFGWMFEYFGAKLTSLDTARNKSRTEELAEELFEIITVFTARYHGKRKYNNKES